MLSLAISKVESTELLFLEACYLIVYFNALSTVSKIRLSIHSWPFPIHICGISTFGNKRTGCGYIPKRKLYISSEKMEFFRE
jgi:hypothetical protein